MFVMQFENDLAKIIVNSCYKIHTTLGPGLFESVYEEVLCYELNKEGMDIKRQSPIPVIYDSVKLDIGFRADIIVEDVVILEIKSVETIAPVHYKQLLTYLKLTNTKLGFLVNFNEGIIKNGIKRVINGY